MLLLYPAPVVLLLRDNPKNAYRRRHKDKVILDSRIWRKENPKKSREQNKKWRDSHPEQMKEIREKWAKEHPDKLREKDKRHYERHPEKMKEKRRKYYNTNKKQEIENAKKWATEHPEQVKENCRKYREANPEKVKEKCKKWRATLRGKIVRSKNQDQRNRNLGSNLINDYFPGCNRHHIDKNNVICIPAFIHKQYPHNHKKPETMIEINQIVFQFLTENIREI